MLQSVTLMYNGYMQKIRALYLLCKFRKVKLIANRTKTEIYEGDAAHYADFIYHDKPHHT